MGIYHLELSGDSRLLRLKLYQKFPTWTNQPEASKACYELDARKVAPEDANAKHLILIALNCGGDC